MDTERGALMKVGDVAKRLGVGRTKVYDLMDGGQLPFVKLGKSRRVEPQEVERLVERSRVGRPG